MHPCNYFVYCHEMTFLVSDRLFQRSLISKENLSLYRVIHIHIEVGRHEEVKAHH
jgi:hypothetical protein